MAKDIVTVIEITKDFLKIAQAQMDQKEPVLSKIITEQIQNLPDDQISKKLFTAIKNNKINTSNTIAIISRQNVTIRHLKLPSVDAKELESMMEFQAQRQLPYSKEEIIYDFWLQKRGAEGYSEVMLAIANKDIIDRYLTILENANIRPKFLSLSSELIFNWYFKEQKEQPLILVDIDSSTTEINFIFEDRLAFTRSLPFGRVQLLQDRQTNTQKLLSEIRNTLSSFNKEHPHVNIKKLIIGGATKDLDWLIEELSKELNITVSKLDTKENEVSTSGILGVIFYQLPPKINLLPKAIKQLQSQLQVKIALMKTTVLFGIIIVIILGIFLKKYSDKIIYLRQLDTKIKDIGPVAENIEQVSRKINLLKSQIDYSNSALEALRELYSIIPQDINLTNFSYDEKGFVNIQGVAPALSGVFKLVTDLEKSQRFCNVQTKFASKRKTKEADIVDFHIQCAMETK